MGFLKGKNCFFCKNKPIVRGKYCSEECRQKQKKEDYKRNSAKYKAEGRYKESKRQADLRYWKKYPNKRKQRDFVKINKIRILKIIGLKCKYCNKSVEEIHHIKYSNLPKRNLNLYCKYLLPLCKEHHRELHKKILPNNYNTFQKESLLTIKKEDTENFIKDKVLR